MVIIIVAMVIIMLVMVIITFIATSSVTINIANISTNALLASEKLAQKRLKAVAPKNQARHINSTISMSRITIIIT